MIHEVGVELAAELGKNGFGVPVLDGPERRPTATFGRERVVIEHVDGDTFGPRHRADKNPRTIMTRGVSCKITIYAQSPSKGAAEFEHRRRAEHALDLVLVAMHKIATRRANQWTPRSGKFIYPEDLAKSEVMGGAVYELLFSFDRGVADRTWTGQALPTANVGPGGVGIQSETKTTTPGEDPSDAETACGGD